MVTVNFRPPEGFSPAASVGSTFGGEFVMIELAPSTVVYSPGVGEESAAYVRKLALVLAQAADQLELSVARSKAAARREANAYADAQAQAAVEAVFGRVV